jgi:hypothetical protein
VAAYFAAYDYISTSCPFFKFLVIRSSKPWIRIRIRIQIQNESGSTTLIKTLLFSFCREETVTLLKYLKATAFAEEYQWWPPPVFILTLTLSQLIFFAIHAAHLVQAGGCAI